MNERIKELAELAGLKIEDGAEWVGLTIQDYHEFLKLSGFDAFKAIETKLKEKNNAN
jgi:hypothetical protein